EPPSSPRRLVLRAARRSRVRATANPRGRGGTQPCHVLRHHDLNERAGHVDASRGRQRASIEPKATGVVAAYADGSAVCELHAVPPRASARRRSDPRDDVIYHLGQLDTQQTDGAGGRRAVVSDPDHVGESIPAALTRTPCPATFVTKLST